MQKISVLDLLREARDATLPSREGFWLAFQAVPVYQRFGGYERFEVIPSAYVHVHPAGRFITRAYSKALSLFDEVLG